MNNSDNNEIKGAPIVMKRRGELTDEKVITHIDNNPNCTITEISESLDMTRGRVDGSVNRLAEEGLVKINYFRRNGVLVKSICPVNSEPRKIDEVIFPKGLIDSSLWEEEAYICALSRSSIAVTPYKKEKWKDRCAFIEKTNLSMISESGKLKLPEKFINFYEIPNSEIDISGFKDELFLSVDSTIIPIDAPYDYATINDPSIIRGRITTIDFEIITQSSAGPRMASSGKSLNLNDFNEEITETYEQSSEVNEVLVE